MPMMTPMKAEEMQYQKQLQQQERMKYLGQQSQDRAIPFEPSARKSNHLYLETGLGSVYHRRSVTEVYGIESKHIVERLRQELAEKDLKVKVRIFLTICLTIHVFITNNLFLFAIKRLRQEKLGLLLKCFTEISTILETLQGQGLLSNEIVPAQFAQ